MGQCNNKQKKHKFCELRTNNKQKKTARSQTSLLIPRDEDIEFERKRNSRLSQTRNSLILQHKSQFDGSQSRVPNQQNNDYLIFELNALPDSLDSFKVIDEQIQSQPVQVTQVNPNNLQLISHDFIIYSFNNQDRQLNLRYDSSQAPKYSILNLDNQISFDSVESKMVIQQDRQEQKSIIFSPKNKNKNRNCLFIPDNMNQLKQSYKRINTLISESKLRKYKNQIIQQFIIQDHLSNDLPEKQIGIINSLSYLIETMQFNQLNFQGVIWILRQILEQQQIQLIVYQPNNNLLIPNQDQVRLFELFLLNCNLPQFYICINFKVDFRHNFRVIFGNSNTRQSFLKKIEDKINSFFQHKYGLKVDIYWIKAIITSIQFNSQLKLGFYIPRVNYNQTSLINQLSKELEIEYEQNFSGIQIQNFIKYIELEINIFDPWGNREFKTGTVDIDFNQSEFDFFEYIPPVGWKRFGILQTGDQNDLSNETEYANGYMQIAISKQKAQFYEFLQEQPDIGPNKNIFEDSKCGIGFIISQNINNWLCGTFNSRIPVNCRCKPIKVQVQNQIRYYYVMLQVIIQKMKIRIPENFSQQIYLVNSLNDLRIKGILVKEITEIEFEDALQHLNQ